MRFESTEANANILIASVHYLIQEPHEKIIQGQCAL